MDQKLAKPIITGAGILFLVAFVLLSPFTWRNRSNPRELSRPLSILDLPVIQKTLGLPLRAISCVERAAIIRGGKDGSIVFFMLQIPESDLGPLQEVLEQRAQRTSFNYFANPYSPIPWCQMSSEEFLGGYSDRKIFGKTSISKPRDGNVKVLVVTSGSQEDGGRYVPSELEELFR